MVGPLAEVGTWYSTTLLCMMGRPSGTAGAWNAGIITCEKNRRKQFQPDIAKGHGFECASRDHAKER